MLSQRRTVILSNVGNDGLLMRSVGNSVATFSASSDYLQALNTSLQPQGMARIRLVERFTEAQRLGVE